MKLPDWLRGKSDEPKPPDLPLPKVDPRALAAEQEAAKERAEREQRARDRKEEPGPAARHLAGQYPAEPLKTEGAKPGTKPPDLQQRVPSQLRNDPSPQQAPDVQKPNGGVQWVQTLTPTGTKAVPKTQDKQAEFRALRDENDRLNAADRDRGGNR